MFSRLIHIVECIRILVFFVAELYSVVLVCHILFIDSAVYAHWAVSTFWLLGTGLLWTCMYIYLFEYLFSVILFIYLGITGWSGSSMYNLELFSKAAEPFYTATSNVQGLQFLHILINSCHFLFLQLSHASESEVIPHCGFNFHFPND